MRLKLPDTLKLALATLVGVALSGCMHITAEQRSQNITDQATAAGWQIQTIRAGQFDLRAINNQVKPVAGVLTVYIEGDGYAWVGGQFPSDDPTPVTPVALNLAMRQPTGAVAYLGRPCQYLGASTNPACTKALWSHERFSEAVITSTQAALNQLKTSANASQLQLVGYSGGAAVALLVAARRNDVTKIVTVAGNLDPVAWATQLKLAPLSGSLNPVDLIPATQHIPQVDFVGGKDKVIPPQITENFIQRYPAAYRPTLISLPDNGHVCCWAEQWPQLSAQAF
ncbi:alpha/beta hydrolase [Fluviibacter phosphoraccumulans]|uniref:alpha/beta hydrolase n=1 Tax=Fluviibacter phosphoraccumulans TaxID=1751046 RepID=UPI001389BFC2|nr:alpha/beta hydrolase [Fluviibacter phosphoraccumulans]